ncbi:MAG: NADH-quinone oxidoreductase subunit J, partial [Actinobacteria bacterium]|nr:NADH-quinone oxidoreductase subunit J [Actinomycetota bacterium]
DPGNVKALARLLFSDYLLPFEATSVLLVVAIVGVMVLTKRVSRFDQVAIEEADPVEAA